MIDVPAAVRKQAGVADGLSSTEIDLQSAAREMLAVADHIAEKEWT